MHTLIQTLVQDLRYAARQLRRAPAFTLTAVLTLALGLGANTAIFTLFHGLLLKPLPVPDPASLIRVGDGNDCCISGSLPRDERYSLFSIEQYRTLRDGTPELEQLAAVSAAGGNGPSTARRAGTPEAALPLRSAYVSGNYFDLFRLEPARGRLLTPADDRAGAPPVAVISYSTWLNQYHADPSVVGSSFLLDARPVTVVGVAPASFYSDRVRSVAVAFYVPMADEPLLSDVPIIGNPQLRSLYLLGRVRPGVALPVLQTKMTAELRHSLATQKAYMTAGGRAELGRVLLLIAPGGGGIQQIQRGQAAGLHLLMGLAGLVLLIACANIANLLLARNTTRRGEAAVRLAVGAARQRLVRQSLTESLLLAAIGGGAGLLLAFAGARAILALAFPDSPEFPISATPSWPILGFSFAVALLTGVLFGAGPAWIASRRDPAEALRGVNRVAGAQTGLGQRALVVLQATLSLVLLTCAGLTGRSLRNAMHQDFGLQTGHRIVVHLDPGASGYDLPRLAPLMQQLQGRLSAIPGVARVAFGNFSPLEGNSWGEGIVVEGKPEPGPRADNAADWDRVSPGFFATIGEPVLRGRDLSPDDRTGSPMTAVVNQTFARKFFPGEDPLGHHFGIGNKTYPYEIVGVVADAKFSYPSAKTTPMFFRSILQLDPHANPRDLGEVESAYPHAILLQTDAAAEGAQVEAEVRKAMAETDPNLAIHDMSSLDEQIDAQLTQDHLVAELTLVFGIIALGLASVGLYGVTAYAVAQRVPEIGVRMALGAGRQHVLRMVLRGALAQTLLGLLLGVPVALLAGHLLQAQLFGIKGADPLTLAAAALVLAASALIANALPARRASTIDPMEALRRQ